MLDCLPSAYFYLNLGFSRITRIVRILRDFLLYHARSFYPCFWKTQKGATLLL